MKPSLNEVEHITLTEYVRNHIEWSKRTFGEGEHLEGLLKHIEKEVSEVREVAGRKEQIVKAGEAVGIYDLDNETLIELVDIVILSIDAMWRIGFGSYEIVSAIIEKQNINANRRYPKIISENEPTEHIRE